MYARYEVTTQLKNTSINAFKTLCVSQPQFHHQTCTHEHTRMHTVHHRKRLGKTNYVIFPLVSSGFTSQLAHLSQETMYWKCHGVG